MKFKFKNLIAFTLSEMMIVLLIVSVISAATIPTITQKKQKPYDVSENNSKTVENWRNDNFSGIFSAFSLNDKEHSVVIGKNTKNDMTRQTIYGSVVPALMLTKSTDSQTRTSDRGQMMLYNKEKFVGSFGFDRYSNTYIGYGSAYDRVMAYNNASVAIGYYANGGESYHSSAIDGTVGIGHYAMNRSLGGAYNVAVGSYAGYYATNSAKTVNIGDCAGSNACYKYYYNLVSTTDPYNYGNIALGANSGSINYATLNNTRQSLNNNISIGYFSGKYEIAKINNSQSLNSCVANNKISIGSYAGKAYTNAETISIGAYAGSLYDGEGFLYCYDGTDPKYDNVISIGHYSNALDDNPSCTANAYLSYSNNINIGTYSGAKNWRTYARKHNSIAIGSYATTEDEPNIAIGYYSSASDLGQIALGSYAFYAGVGSGAGFGAIAIGRYAASGNTGIVTVTNLYTSNIFIGYYAGYRASSKTDRSILIGNYAGAYSNKGSNHTGGSGLLVGYGTFSSSDSTRVMIPYASKTLKTDTGGKFIDNYNGHASMAIGPGYGYPGGPSFNNTILVLYASSIYARSTTFSPFSSDKRSKENIEKAKYGIEQFRHINTYTYNFKFDNDKKPRVGLIAQEVQKYIPEAIVKSADGTLTIDFDWILYSLANAIKDVDNTLTQMKKDLIAQAKDLTQLEKRIFKLENKTTKTLEKQEKMQIKLNQANDIVNNMETK